MDWPRPRRYGCALHRDPPGPGQREGWLGTLAPKLHLYCRTKEREAVSVLVSVGLASHGRIGHPKTEQACGDWRKHWHLTGASSTRHLEALGRKLILSPLRLPVPPSRRGRQVTDAYKLVHIPLLVIPTVFLTTMAVLWLKRGCSLRVPHMACKSHDAVLSSRAGWVGD